MYRSITLPNGAKLLTEFVPGARTAALGFFVGTGSRHERAAESGAAHFQGDPAEGRWRSGPGDRRHRRADQRLYH